MRVTADNGGWAATAGAYRVFSFEQYSDPCLWNSLYLDQSVRRLREEGAKVRDEDLARVSPLSRAHVNVLGRYSFDLDESLAGGGMRPLRNPSEIEEDELSPLL